MGIEKKPALLISTLGRTDIQVVLPCSKDETPRRYSLQKRSVRSFQEACATGKIQFRMLGLETMLPLEVRTKELSFDPHTCTVSTSLSGDSSDDIDSADWSKSDGQLILCAPLMHNVYEKLNSPEYAAWSIVRILVMTTRRKSEIDGNPRLMEEPAFAFDLLAPVLTQFISSGIGSSTDILECNMIDEGDFYVEGPRGDSRIRNAIAKTIDTAIQKAIGIEPKPRMVLINDIGGIPDIKPLIAAIACYRAGNVRYLRSTESKGGISKRTSIAATDSFETRKLCFDLCCRGAFTAAAELARQNDGNVTNAKSEPWRKALKSLSDVLQGDLRVANESCNWPADSAMHEKSKHLARAGYSFTLAFRIESALRSMDIVTAIRDTIRFVEIVRRDWLDKNIPHGNGDLFNETGWPIWLKITHSAQDKIPQDWLDDRKRWMLNQEELLWQMVELFVSNAETQSTLLRFKDLLCDESIRGLNGLTFRDLRHKATHGKIQTEEVESAHKFAVDKGLWSDQPMKFLRSTLVGPVLSPNTVNRPSELYEEVLQSIKLDMDRFSLQVEES